MEVKYITDSMGNLILKPNQVKTSLQNKNGLKKCGFSPRVAEHPSLIHYAVQVTSFTIQPSNQTVDVFHFGDCHVH